MQWKPANKHMEKYWCLLTNKVCREPPLAAPLPAGIGRGRLWQHVEIRLSHSGSITSSAAEGSEVISGDSKSCGRAKGRSGKEPSGKQEWPPYQMTRGAAQE